MSDEKVIVTPENLEGIMTNVYDEILAFDTKLEKYKVEDIVVQDNFRIDITKDGTTTTGELPLFGKKLCSTSLKDVTSDDNYTKTISLSSFTYHYLLIIKYAYSGTNYANVYFCCRPIAPGTGSMATIVSHSAIPVSSVKQAYETLSSGAPNYNAPILSITMNSSITTFNGDCIAKAYGMSSY